MVTTMFVMHMTGLPMSRRVMVVAMTIMSMAMSVRSMLMRSMSVMSMAGRIGRQARMGVNGGLSHAQSRNQSRSQRRGHHSRRRNGLAPQGANKTTAFDP